MPVKCCRFVGYNYEKISSLGWFVDPGDASSYEGRDGIKPHVHIAPPVRSFCIILKFTEQV
jgi:hypothetical protein